MRKFCQVQSVENGYTCSFYINDKNKTITFIARNENEIADIIRQQIGGKDEKAT